MVDGEEVIEEEVEEVEEEEISGQEEKVVEREETPRTYTVKIGGKETQVSEEELVQGYQMRKASDETFREAAESRRQSEALIKMLKEDPKALLKHKSLGLNDREIAEEILYGYLQDEKLSPEARDLKAANVQLEEYKKLQQQVGQSQKQQHEAAAHKQMTHNLQQEIISALKENNIPQTNATVGRVSRYMMSAVEHNRKDITMKQIAGWVQKDYYDELKSHTAGLSEDAILELLGDEVAGKLRKADLKKLQNPQDKLKSPNKKAGTRKGRKKKGSLEDFLRVGRYADDEI